MLRLSAWSLAVLAVAAIAAIGVAYKQRYNASLDAVAKTLAVESAANEALALLRDAETGQRGFLLTAQSELLAPYTAAKDALPRQLERLRALTADSQEQNDYAVHVSSLARAKLDELEETVHLREQGRSDEALAIVREGRGRRLMDSARAEIAALLARSHAELAERQAAAERDLERLVDVLLGSWALLALALAVSVGSAMRRADAAKRAADSIASGARAARAVADNASDLVRIINDRAELVYVSPSCEPILGFTRDEMLAMPPRALLHEDDREPTRLLTLRVQQGEQIDAPHLHRLRTKSGAYRLFETKFRLVRDGDSVTSQIHLTSRDITDRVLRDPAWAAKISLRPA